MKEKSIIPKSKYWKTERFDGSERHELMFGRANRKKAIEDGLYVYLTKEEHTGKNGFEYNRQKRLYGEWVAMNAWCKYYNKTYDDFKARYGRYAIQPIEQEFVDNDFENYEF